MFSTIAILVWNASLAASAEPAPAHAPLVHFEAGEHRTAGRSGSAVTEPSVRAAPGPPNAAGERPLGASPNSPAPPPPAPRVDDGDATTAPESAASSPQPPTVAAPPTADSTSPNSSAADPPPADSLPADLLEGGEIEPNSPAARISRPAGSASEEETDEERAERARAYYRELYRPTDNHHSLGTTARGIFTLIEGSDGATSGRVGGLVADLWLRWNYVGIGLSGFVLGGRVNVGDERTTNVALMTGGGPSVGLGRLALIGRGFLDLNVGYDFGFMPGTRSATTGAGSTNVAFAPHGPRARVDFGLVAPSKRNKRRFHGFGASLGFQYFAGDLSGNGFPSAPTLSLGLCYYGS